MSDFRLKMKDTPVKPSIAPPLPIKSKPGPKKDKMAAKKLKEHKTPIMKVGKTKKASNMDKKSKLNKDNSVPEVKRKRGRPRNEDRLLIKKPVKEQKNTKKSQDGKTPGRKRKINPEKEFVYGHLKKPKISDNNCSINGDIKMPITPVNKPFVQKGESPAVVEHSLSSALNSNGTLHNKKVSMFSQKKAPLSILKAATFQIPAPTPPKKELLNGNSSLPSFKFQPSKNKTLFKKDIEFNSLPKEMELNSKVEKLNNFSVNNSSLSVNNDLPKCPSKETKLFCKESVKSQPKETVKPQVKDSPKPPVKEPLKSLPKETAKQQVKDSVKPQIKDQPKTQLKEPARLNSTKVQEPNKSQPKDPVKPQPKDPVKPLPKDPPPPVKSHPVRMATLDALARMHVICTTDRKPPRPKTTVAVSPQRPFSTQKSITHERIQVDVKKETNEFKGNIVHKQEINFVKEKQQVFVSHSVEQSSIVEHEQSKTVSTKTQQEKEKKKKVKLPEKPVTNNKKIVKSKIKPSPSNNLKLAEKVSKLEKCKPKGAKTKEVEKKNIKIPGKIPSKATKVVKEKPDVKSNCKKTTKKVEQTKSEVKVKETIRMQKTCTYQSVTTVNSNGTTNTSVVPVSHVGMTTNFSKTKKTVVTDEECKNKVNYSSGSVINNTYCLTTESPCSVGPHTDCCKLHAHPQFIPLAHVQACSLGHSMNRTADPTTSASHCDGSSFPMHRFGHQQPVILTPSECGKSTFLICIIFSYYFQLNFIYF